MHGLRLFVLPRARCRALGFALLLGWTGSGHAATTETDLVIYGGTAAGVMAAVEGSRLGKSVVLIEPGRRLGGLTSGGLGQTDIGNKRAIGGFAREFYRAVRRHYEDPSAWRWQAREEYRDGGQTRTGGEEDAMWTFEPGVALKILNDFVRDAGVTVAYGERLDLGAGVRKRGNRIESIGMESGRRFRGRMFIDATYEGDLMAKAGVTYVVGREPNDRYGETLNGVQTAQARFHQLVPGVDPYVRPGDPSSGLLPGIDPAGPGRKGAGDHRVQAYCFRMCLTDHPENRVPFHRPDGYRELDYELMLRNFEAGERGMPWINSAMPNRKTDTNNRTGFSTDFIGQNYAYPDGDYATRAEIVRRHLHYQQGLMWTLANHPRVPESIRGEVRRWGMTRDEFLEGNGWQEQLYVREARRMVGRLVMTQHHCQGSEVVDDPIGLAAYGMDSHHVQRYVDGNGHVQNEGDVEVGGFAPYPISYRAITPREADCANLLVPVCLSASHIAFGSIRMEPVFMVLGQSAAAAAVQAIDEAVSVQQVVYDRLRVRLETAGQVLAWTPAAK
ncbi:MAG: FAD-dependent oxidoreductase [Verrucomicrobia bacterium]|nr:FAD-dependent oxidoreductase [Verrucomicrobiota bacterium]